MKTNLINILPSLTHFTQPLSVTWEISETSLAFSLIRHQCFYQRKTVPLTIVHYKLQILTATHCIHLVKNSSPCSQCIRLRRVCSDDSNFTSKSDEMYTDNVQRLRLSRLRCRNRTRADHAQEIDLKNSTTAVPKILGRKNSIHTDLTPTKQSCKNNILTNSNYFKKQKHRIFHNHAPLVSYKRDKKVGTFLVRSSLKTEEQPDSFKRSRFNTRPFIQNTVNILGPKYSIKITDRFDRTSTNVTHYITFNLYKMAKQGGGEETT